MKTENYPQFFVTYLPIQFEKHTADSGYQLHFVPSMIRFRSPVSKKNKYKTL